MSCSSPKTGRRIKASQTQLRAKGTRILRQGQGNRNPQRPSSLLARICINSLHRCFVPVCRKNFVSRAMAFHPNGGKTDWEAMLAYCRARFVCNNAYIFPGNNFGQANLLSRNNIREFETPHSACRSQCEGGAGCQSAKAHPGSVCRKWKAHGNLRHHERAGRAGIPRAPSVTACSALPRWTDLHRSRFGHTASLRASSAGTAPGPRDAQPARRENAAWTAGQPAPRAQNDPGSKPPVRMWFARPHAPREDWND